MVIHVLLFVNRQVAGELDFRLACFCRLFCSNNNHAVGCPCPVNGCGCCIFQDGNTFNVVWIQIFDISLDGQTVYNKQGVGFRIQAACTTNGCLVTVCHQACYAPLQVIKDIWSIAFLQLAGSNRRGRPCHLFTHNGLVTGYYYIFQFTHLFLHDYIQYLLPCIGNFLCFHAHKREYQDNRFRGGHLHCVIAIDVRCYAHRRAF